MVIFGFHRFDFSLSIVKERKGKEMENKYLKMKKFDRFFFEQLTGKSFNLFESVMENVNQCWNNTIGHFLFISVNYTCFIDVFQKQMTGHEKGWQVNKQT